MSEKCSIFAVELTICVMSNVTYKIRVNRPCRLFIDDEEVMILDESKLTKISLPCGEYLRKVVAIDDRTIFDEAVINLTEASSKLDNIILDIKGLNEARAIILQNGIFKVGELYYQSAGNYSVEVCYNENEQYTFTDIIIPEEIIYAGYRFMVSGIGSHAFSGSKTLSSVTIPNSVTYIGDFAFSNCIELTSIKIPYGVEYIGEGTFCGCSSIRDLSIPNSVNVIENEAFKSCANLNSIKMPETMDKLGGAVFSHCSSLESIIIPEGVTELNSHIIDTYDLPFETVDVIEGMFEACTKLSNIQFPNSLIKIGKQTFDRCSALASVSLPNSIKVIDDHAFRDCVTLISITIPRSVSHIGDNVFWDCPSLEKIYLPKNIFMIGEMNVYKHTEIIQY